MNQNLFKAGDRIKRVKNGNQSCMLGSEWIVTRIYEDNVYYKGVYAAHYTNFELVQSSDSEVKYPLFMIHKYTSELVKFTNITKGRTLICGPNSNPLGSISYELLPHTDSRWEPCDFTIEPETPDLDWWDARHEAGLPVWVELRDNSVELAERLKPSEWTNFLKLYTSNPSCQDNVKANQSIQKEQPMTIQQLLTKLFGAAMPTDYDRRSAYLVVAYNRDGSEIGTATADTLKQVKDKVADTPELWGCKVLTYKLDKEVSVTVPVKATEAKVVEPVKDGE